MTWTQFAGGERPRWHVRNLGKLVLSQETDLQIKVSPLAGLCGHPVLRDQHERRKKNGFDGRNHAKHDESRVPRRHPRYQAQVCDDPETERREMEVDKPHAARKRR